MTEKILYAVDAGVAHITLNKPDMLNAFDEEMSTTMRGMLKTAKRDGSVRAILVTGAGRGFCSGQDLSDVPERDESFSLSAHLRNHYNKLIMQMVTLEKPIIGAINGVAAGMGCSLALATDLRIASDKASFLQAFSRVGLVPDSGSTWFLPRIIGYTRAFEMAALAEKISAEKALHWGLVNQVVPHEQLPEIATAVAQRLASGPTLAYGLTKRAMNRAIVTSLSDALEYEALLQDIAGDSEDRHEGIAAFLEKRKPAYKGK